MKLTKLTRSRRASLHGARNLLGCVLLLVPSAVGCKDPMEKAAQDAEGYAKAVGQRVESDVAAIESGLPKGAKALGALYAKNADPRQDDTAVKSGLKKARQSVEELRNGMTLFSVLTDEKGIAIRSDFEVDTMLGKDFFQIFPALAEVTTKDYVQTTGQFPDTARDRDVDWVGASPVRRADGTVAGIFVTGWPYRWFSKHLLEMAKNRLHDKAKEEGAHDPLVHVLIFDKNDVYGAKGTPDVVEQAMKKLDLVAKTASGPYHAIVPVEDHKYALGAVRVERLAKDTGVVVLKADL